MEFGQLGPKTPLLRTEIYLSGLMLRNRFLGLRHFGEICMEARAFFVRKTYKFQQN